MAITFAWRSDTSTAKARFGSHTDAHLNNDIDYLSITGAIGGSAFQANNTIGSVSFSGHENFGAASGGAFSILCRYAPTFASVPSSEVSLIAFGVGMSELQSSFNVFQRTSGQIILRAYDEKTTLRINTGPVFTSTANTFYDYVITGHLNDGSGTYQIFIDGVTQAAGALTNFITNYTSSSINVLSMGFSGLRKSQYSYNELVVWDEIIDPNNITLVSTGGTTSTGQALNGSSRSGWVDVSAREKSVSTNPVASNVLSGTGYTIDGLSYTGTYSPPTSTDPQVENVLSGTTYIINDVTLTGTLVAGGTYTDPDISNVRAGTSYIFNDSTLTGTLSVPTPVDGTAGTVNIGNIKEQIRYILDNNNTTTSSVLDLSSGLTSRVQQIAKLNPEVIPIQSTKFPVVTVHATRKAIESRTIAKDQVSGKRRCVLTLTIVGMVYNQNFSSNIWNDPADQDIEKLMENVERILRSYHDLNSNVTWQVASDVTYHNAAFDEQTHMRVGLLDIEATIFY
jgi:hypothetical protein